MLGEQGLINIDPERARLDPVIVPNVPYYKAQLQVQAEVDQLQPPPRPANWVVSLPVSFVFVSCKLTELQKLYECRSFIFYFMKLKNNMNSRVFI